MERPAKFREETPRECRTTQEPNTRQKQSGKGNLLRPFDIRLMLSVAIRF